MVFIDEVNVLEPTEGVSLLRVPSFTGVFSMKNQAACANDPTTRRRNKIDAEQFLLCFDVKLLPTHTAVCGVQDRAAVTDYPSFVFVHKPNRIQTRICA